MSGDHHHSDHMPDRTKLPHSLQRCDWQGVPDEGREWVDGSAYLAAVAVCSRGVPGWRYEIFAIHISCDDSRLSVVTNEGDLWGWSLSDIDFLLPLNGDSC